MPAEAKDFNRVIGHVLRFGVTIAFAVIALGTTLLFVEGQTGYGSLNGQFYDNRFVLGLAALFQGLASARPFAIIELGLILLFATPIARVAISIFLFFEEKRYAFVFITITVLAILLLSTFVIGPLLRT